MTSEISQTLNYDGSVFFTGTSSYNIPSTPLTDVREYLQQAETTKNRIERSTYLFRTRFRRTLALLVL